jgi:hypothetical protein
MATSSVQWWLLKEAEDYVGNAQISKTKSSVTNAVPLPTSVRARKILRGYRHLLPGTTLSTRTSVWNESWSSWQKIDEIMLGLVSGFGELVGYLVGKSTLAWRLFGWYPFLIRLILSGYIPVLFIVVVLFLVTVLFYWYSKARGAGVRVELVVSLLCSNFYFVSWR